MMARNLRKVVSILCVVAIVLSFSVSTLAGTFSAAGINDAPAGTEPNGLTSTRYEYNFIDDATKSSYYAASDSAFKFITDADADENGLLIEFTKKASLSANSNYLGSAVMLRDKDNNLGDANGSIKIEAGKRYAVVVKYKVADFGENASVDVALAFTNAAEPTGYEDDNLGRIKPIVETAKNITSTDTQYLIAYIDGDASYKYSSSATAPNAGKRLAIAVSTARNGRAAEVLIENVTVTVVDKSVSNNPVFVTTYAEGIPTVYGGQASVDWKLPDLELDANSGYTFVSWCVDEALTTALTTLKPVDDSTVVYAKCQKLTKVIFNNSGSLSEQYLLPGESLANPKRPNGKVYFMGWYTDLEFKNKVTEVPATDCTLYAKYNLTEISFDNGGYSDLYAGNAGGKITHVVDPADPNNKLLKLDLAYARGMIEVGTYDAEGEVPAYVLKPNTTYQFSFRYKTDALGADVGLNVNLQLGAQTVYSDDSSETRLANLDAYTVIGTAPDGHDWITVNGQFTTNSNLVYERVNFTVQDKLYLCVRTTTKRNGYTQYSQDKRTVYVDDFLFGEVSDELPEDLIQISFETNSEALVPSFGMPGDDIDLPTPENFAGHEFEGWYVDKELTVPFTDTVFGTENMTLYAKWKFTEWVMDFEQHSTGASLRYNSVKMDSNTVMRYNYEQGNKYNTSSPSAFGGIMLNHGQKAPYLAINGVTYKISFKYMVEETDSDLSIRAVTAAKFDRWNNAVDQGDLAWTEPKSEIELGVWKTGEFEFTAVFDETKINNSHLGFTVAGDHTTYFDDITVLASYDFANCYGDVIYKFNTLSADFIYPMSGNVGESLKLPVATRAGHMFDGWYEDLDFKTKFTGTTFGTEDKTLYAKFLLGTFSESFEELPKSVQTAGIAPAYKLYTKDTPDFSAANLYKGGTALYRDGSYAGDKAFTISRSKELALEIGRQYTVTFYVKPTEVTNAAGTISLLGLENMTKIGKPESTTVITNVGSLNAGKWNKVSYTFTAKSEFLGISSSEGNSMYFDNVTVTLNGYNPNTGSGSAGVGGSTGDASVSPYIVLAMIVLAAGAIVVTGKKVYSK